MWSVFGPAGTWDKRCQSLLSSELWIMPHIFSSSKLHVSMKVREEAMTKKKKEKRIVNLYYITHFNSEGPTQWAEKDWMQTPSNQWFQIWSAFIYTMFRNSKHLVINTDINEMSSGTLWALSKHRRASANYHIMSFIYKRNTNINPIHTSSYYSQKILRLPILCSAFFGPAHTQLQILIQTH